jgi:predicted membrane protein
MSTPVTPENASTDRHISKLAIIGALLLPIGFLVVLVFIPLIRSTNLNPPSTWQNLLRSTLLLAAVIAPFVSTTLGFISVSQIRRSKGAIHGLPLAVFVSLFYPIIILDLILVYLGYTFLGRLQVSSLIPLAWFFLILLIDYLIVRLTWRSANN